MIMLQFLIFFGPAALSVLLYEVFSGGKRSNFSRAALLLAFAFCYNLLALAVIWFRGNDMIYWIDVEMNVSFYVRYAAVEMVPAVVVPFVLSLVKVGKRNDKSANK